MIEETLDRKIRNYQAKVIAKEGISYSYSTALTDLLEKTL